MQPRGHQLSNPLIWNVSKHHSEGYRDKAKHKSNSPCWCSLPRYGESGAAHEDDHNLPSYDDELYGHEKVIPLNAFEDVEFVVQATIVVLIEDLHPDEGVEDHGLLVVSSVAGYWGSSEIEHQCHDMLVY